jgi:hypothetical protein
VVVAVRVRHEEARLLAMTEVRIDILMILKTENSKTMTIELGNSLEVVL